jgi:hypothetical protein
LLYPTLIHRTALAGIYEVFFRCAEELGIRVRTSD